MSPEYSLCPQSKVYVLRVQFSPLSTVNGPRVQFMSSEYSLCPQSTVSVPREQFMSLEYS